ncbi:MAG TPA: hypothetical protein VMR16_02280 [Candidatus Saccharimonadales bacterium]|nr:hypothetical protein [Candidatus Saccharimonadales bacterium]
MHSSITTPLTILVSLLVLFGWFISDFRAGDAVNLVVATAAHNVTYIAEDISIMPATSSPNIDTNWFTGSSASITYQLPSAQSKKSDDDEHIAQGRVVGDSYGKDGDL